MGTIGLLYSIYTRYKGSDARRGGIGEYVEWLVQWPNADLLYSVHTRYTLLLLYRVPTLIVEGFGECVELLVQ